LGRLTLIKDELAEEGCAAMFAQRFRRMGQSNAQIFEALRPAWNNGHFYTVEI
jgi:hypothetical protein